MSKYRKKPVVIEAWQMPITRDVFDKLERLSNRKLTRVAGMAPRGDNPEIIRVIHIGTLEGTMIAKGDDWIIKGVEGEFYPCKDSVFRATYEKVD